MNRTREFFLSLVRSHSLLFPIAGGILSALGYIVGGIWLLVLLGFLPLIHHLSRAESYKESFHGAFFFGLVYMGGALSWYFNALPLDWAGIGNLFVGALIVFVVWTAESLLFAALSGVGGLIFHALRSSPFKNALVFSFIWVVIEWVKAVGVTILWAGPGTLIGAHWTLGAVGYVLADNEYLRAFSGVGGVYLLSFIAVLLPALVYAILVSLNKTSWRIAGVSIFLIGLVFLAGDKLSEHYQATPVEKTISAAIMQTQFPALFEETPASVTNRFIILTALLAQINKATAHDTPVDMVILPEDMRYYDTLAVAGKQKGMLLELLGEQNANATVIDSGSTASGGKFFGRFLYIDPSGDVRATSTKRFLMPFGEYVPYSVSFLARMLGQSSWLFSYENDRGAYTPGDTSSVGTLWDGTKVGSLLCSEIVSPPLHSALVKLGAEVLVNASSHSSLHGAQTLEVEQLRTAQVRAAEQNRYLIESANATRPLVLSNTGEILYHGKAGAIELGIYSHIEVIKTLSFYTKHGDWMALLSALCLIIFAAFFRWRAFRAFIHTK